MDVKWGIYDTKDDCWLGDNNGPRLFGDEQSKAANGCPAETLTRTRWISSKPTRARRVSWL